MQLSEVEMRESRRTRTPSQAAPAMNMYIALWRSLGSSAKAKMLSHKKSIGTDGPTLLWTLLRTYQGTAAQVIRTTMKLLDKLYDTLKHQKFNIDKFCDYGLKTLSTLTDAGGDDTQAFDKFYEALKNTPNQEFNNVLVVWKSVLDQTATPLDVGELLCKAREEYRGMVALKTWATSSGQVESIPKKSKQDRDIAALIANSAEANAKINAMTKAMAKSSKKGYAALTGNRDAKKSGSKHDWIKQYGDGKDFPDKSSFMTWLHEAPTKGKKAAKKNGIIWYWCEKCIRFTSHKSTECTKTSKREKRVAFAGVASVGADVYTDDGLNSSDDWSESEQETPPPRKKFRTHKRTKKNKFFLSSDEESDSDE